MDRRNFIAVLVTAGAVGSEFNQDPKPKKHKLRSKNPAGSSDTLCEWSPGKWGECCSFSDGSYGPCIDKHGEWVKVPGYEYYNSDGTFSKIPSTKKLKTSKKKTKR